MRRTAALVYGVVCYAVFFATFLYLVGFLGNLVVPVSVDSGSAGPLGPSLLIDALLVLVFGLQHTVMARPGFKTGWTRIVPRPVERSTYVLFSSLALIALVAFWQPIPNRVWHFEGTLGTALTGLFLAGVGLVLLSTFLIDHFDLFGLRQVVLYFRGKSYTQKSFGTPFLYKWIRHPLYVGWLLTVWVTPSMSVGHLLLATSMTVYILIAIPFEERDLVRFLGEPYRRWRESTPLFVPRLRPGAAKAPTRVAR